MTSKFLGSERQGHAKKMNIYLLIERKFYTGRLHIMLSLIILSGWCVSSVGIASLDVFEIMTFNVYVFLV